MRSKNFFDSKDSSDHGGEGTAERYDRQQSVYRTPVVDSTFIDEAQQARNDYELEQAKREFIKLKDNLPNASCKEQFQDWVVSQSALNQTNFTKSK